MVIPGTGPWITMDLRFNNRYSILNNNPVQQESLNLNYG
jgi:hypothetical protein